METIRKSKEQIFLECSARKSYYDINDIYKAMQIFADQEVNHNLTTANLILDHHARHVIPGLEKRIKELEGENERLQNNRVDTKQVLDDNTKYTYYRIELVNCGHEYDYTMVANLSDIMDILRMEETNLDDDETQAEIRITGVGMTPIEFQAWIDSCEDTW